MLGLVRPKSRDAPEVKALPIVLGKGVGPLVVGSWLEDVERALGPCRFGIHLAPTRTCAYPGWGIDVGLEAGRVARISVYREGRELLGAPARSRGFRGTSAEGVELGTTAPTLVSKLGEPDERLAPQTGPATELWVWKTRGVAVELEPGDSGLIAGALHLPRVSGRPKP